jgi:Leucine Rich repeat
MDRFQAGSMANMTAKPISHSRRRHLRFSVRGLLVLVVIIAVWLGWIVRSAHVQRDAVAAIQKAGGYVSYDAETPAGIPAGNAWTPRWVMDFIGVDYFDHVDFAGQDFQSTAAESAIVLAQVGRLTRIRCLHFSQSAVSGPLLIHLRGLTSLDELDLSETKINDAGLEHLKGLTSLTDLWLDQTPVTDAGLVHLKGLTGLIYLHLAHTQVSGAGLEHLKGLTKLQVLDLTGSPVTDAGLEHLRGLTDLGELRLAGTKVSDAAVEKLGEELPNTVVFH